MCFFWLKYYYFIQGRDNNGTTVKAAHTSGEEKKQ